MNIAHSITQKLKNESKARSVDFTLILARYGVERLLFRLTHSEYDQQFILKGASMFLVWYGQNLRVTRDVDLLGFGVSTVTRLHEIFSAVIAVECEHDGLSFDAATLVTAPIKEADEYNGVRITMIAFLERVRIPIQIDIGFGDAVTPDAELVDYPTLIAKDAIQIRGYSPYTLAAEKIEAMVKLGIANSRMKDFYDLTILSRSFAFEGNLFIEAITNTFTRRKTEIPQKIPFSLTDEFYRDESKIKQWNAFLKKSKATETMGTLEEVISEISPMILPLFDGTCSNMLWRKSWVEP